MKYFFTLLMGLSASMALGQGLKIVSSKSIPDPASAYQNYDKISYATVKNTTTSDMTLKVVRTKNQVSPGQDTKFCWVTCYSPATDSSQNSFTLHAGETDSVTFYAYFESHGNLGAASATYKFYTTGLGSSGDTASVTFNYLAQGAAGISERTQGALTSIYPNPSNTVSVVNYNLAGGETGALVLYNILGVEVFRSALSNTQTEQIIQTGNLTDGVYFCSLYVNNKLSSSTKLIVKH